MSHYNVKPIRLDFKASRLLAGILAVAGLGACIIIICMPIDNLLKLLVCPLVLLATSYHIADKALMRMPWSCTGLILDAKGVLIARTRTGDDQEISVQASSFVASYLTILNYRAENKYWQRSVLLLPDNVDADAYRQLRVWLRWARQASLAAET